MMSPVESTPPESSRRPGPEWTFLTNHAHVLHCVHRDPSVRTRDIAIAVGITERRTQAILKDLEEGGYLVRTKTGRRNSYRINGEALFRHPLESHRAVVDLLTLLDLDLPPIHISHST
jgi:Mn-dependent DtxR family transcriptional regulator